MHRLPEFGGEPRQGHDALLSKEDGIVGPRQRAPDDIPGLAAVEDQSLAQRGHRRRMGRHDGEIVLETDAIDIEHEPGAQPASLVERLHDLVEPVLGTLPGLGDGPGIEARTREEEPFGQAVRRSLEACDGRRIVGRQGRQNQGGHAGPVVEVAEEFAGDDHAVHSPVDPAHPKRPVDVLDRGGQAAQAADAVPFRGFAEGERAPSVRGAAQAFLGDRRIIVEDHRRQTPGVVLVHEAQDVAAAQDALQPGPIAVWIGQLPALEGDAVELGPRGLGPFGHVPGQTDQNHTIAEGPEDQGVGHGALSGGVAIGEFEGTDVKNDAAGALRRWGRRLVDDRVFVDAGHRHQ